MSPTRTQACIAGVLVCVLALQGCGGDGEKKKTEKPEEPDGGEEPEVGGMEMGEKGKSETDILQEKLAFLEGKQEGNCQQKCANMAVYGRWSGKYGHSCWETVQGVEKMVCTCSHSETPPAECDTAKPSNEGFIETADSVPSASSSPAPSGSLVDVQAHKQSAAKKAAKADGSPRETVHKFCDAAAALDMRGGADELGDADQEDTDFSSTQSNVESAILADIARELEENNVDKMAKEIFTFYICVRWVPDDRFATIAKQEMAAQVISNVTEKQATEHQVIAELYRQYKFVPLLCSQNLEVFSETDDEDHTYFRHFQKEVKKLSSWMDAKKGSAVDKRLAEVDNIFCGDKPMNSGGCDFEQRLTDKFSKYLKPFGINWASTEDKWDKMSDIFNSFDGDEGAEDWQEEVNDYKQHLPYHSFIDKPGGMPVDASPNANDRILVCFGKRVASELHRRPNGKHILADQNNIGCHGWWSAEEAAQMLDRIVALWKPPTCQLADMVYTMKREILMMFKNMNEKLFDALPTMIMDEEMDKKGILEQHIAGPGPFNHKQATIGNEVFVDGMRVMSNVEVRYLEDDDYTFDATKCKNGFTDNFGKDLKKCNYVVDAGAMGTVKLDQDNEAGAWSLKVIWDMDEKELVRSMDVSKLTIKPHEWLAKKKFSDYAADLVTGFKYVHVQAKSIYSTVFGTGDHHIKKYNNLAAMMSDSVSKWIVCPINKGTDLEHLDAHLGVEDTAFKDFRKEAYAKWTGYKAKIPGEECVAAPNLGKDFSKAKTCDLSELHADHVEKYTIDIQKKETEHFICPIKPPLPADEQLTILSEKRNTCYLRMTANQQRQYGWSYQGKFPARKQYDRRENVPKVEYELVKLMNVPGGGEASEVSLGLYCSLDELKETPRFCSGPVLQNPWPTVDEMASALKDAVAGSFGVSASALVGAVSMYQDVVQKNRSAGEWATALGEKTWNGLTGVGRLLQSTSDIAVVAAGEAWANSGRRVRTLEEELFLSEESGVLLHGMSFQKGIGTNGRTSNAKERFERYVVSYPCGDFDPGQAFASRREWGDIALRMIREAHNWHGDKILQRKVLETSVRAEGLLFARPNVQTANDTWFKYSAGMHVSAVAENKCKGNWVFFVKAGCEPKAHCAWQGDECKVRSEEGWWALKSSVATKSLLRVLGGISATGADMTDLKGFRMELFCGAKKDFGSTEEIGQVPTPKEELRQCMERGVKHNAALKAREPWKRFFQTEVVVAAVFKELSERNCEVEQAFKTKEELSTKLCTSGAIERSGITGHLKDGQKDDSSFLGKPGKYVGIHTGADFPKGTPKEVVLHPEDVLEAIDALP